MYKDIITSLKIPAFYILLNSKKEELYDIVYESIRNNILKEDYNNLNFETIVTDQELALINSIKNFSLILKEYLVYFITNKIF